MKSPHNLVNHQRTFKKNKKVKLTYLFEVDLRNLIPQASSYNPVQICPVRAVHDIIPVRIPVAESHHRLWNINIDVSHIFKRKHQLRTNKTGDRKKKIK